jgi:dihydrofolate reductase
MTKVTAQMSVSLDGYYAGPRSTADPHDMAAWMEGLVNSRIVEETFAAAGAYVMGRRMFDGGEIPWGDEPPFRAPVFVVTHRDREALQRQGGTSFTFVTDGIERAVAMAREAAGGKDVAVAGGGTLLRQVLAAGLLDELELHIAPVLLGDGMRLFGAGSGAGAGASLGLDTHEGIELTPVRVVETQEVTHIRYAVGDRAKLELDDRGSGGA